MNSSTDQVSPLKKKLLQVLTFVLWLTTVALGFLVLTTALDAVDAQILAFTFEKVESQEMGLTTGNGLRRIAAYATVFVLVVIWIGGIAIAGMEYHLKRSGQRKSYRILAWTIGIEVILIVVGILLQQTV